MTALVVAQHHPAPREPRHLVVPLAHVEPAAVQDHHRAPGLVVDQHRGEELTLDVELLRHRLKDDGKGTSFL